MQLQHTNSYKRDSNHAQIRVSPMRCVDSYFIVVNPATSQIINNYITIS